MYSALTVIDSPCPRHNKKQTLIGGFKFFQIQVILLSGSLEAEMTSIYADDLKSAGTVPSSAVYW